MNFYNQLSDILLKHLINTGCVNILLKNEAADFMSTANVTKWLVNDRASVLIQLIGL